MQNINSQVSLREAIARLEIQQAEEARLLKEQLHITYLAMQPVNILKSSLKEVANSEQVKQDILNAAVNAASGYAAKLLFNNKNISPEKKVAGGAAILGITNLIAENPETVKKVASGFFKIIRILVKNTSDRK